MSTIRKIIIFALLSLLLVEVQVFSGVQNMANRSRTEAVHVEVWPTFDCELFKERFDRKSKMDWFKPRFKDAVNLSSSIQQLTPYKFLMNLLQGTKHPQMYKYVKNFRVYRRSPEKSRYVLVHKDAFESKDILLSKVHKGDILVFHG